MSTSDRACAGCRFWEPPNREYRSGECRRYAPRANNHGAVTFARTYDKDWCGEWVEREEPRMDTTS